MPSDRDLFQSAIDIPEAGARAEYLSANAPDSEQRARIERLLAAHAAAGGFLEQPSAEGDFEATRTAGDATRTAVTSDDSPGTVIAGKYKLLQQIGEGGMGTVWMADQTEPIKRRIAVKLIRVDRGSSATILARFEAERQAIALMDHPHIAKLLDAGTTDAGQPYFIMELVKGIPLTEFCDAHKLSVQQRLGLFQQICSAVQHAHQKGIIHRDLKPTNILVESHDGKPVPKVIDFGLAKATSGLQLTEHSLFTAFGSVMGTPLYMAPEQASFNAIDVDTRADIYALGVILYELLTGTTPLTRDTAKKAALDEMLKLVREQEAPPPSSRLSSADALPSVAANRQTEPAKLGRFVKGELDWIVLKALSKERDRRYETANGFAKDIERFLNHEPVQAGPVGAAYKLRKFVRRNRGQVIAASLVLSVLLAGMAGTTWGLIEAKKQERLAVAAQQAEADRAEGERLAKLEAQANEKLAGERLVQVEAERKKADAAKVEAQAKEAEANAVVKFFEDQVFAAARPKNQAGGLGAGVTLRAAVVASVPALEKGFAEQPLVEARLRNALGLTFHYLAEHEQARDQFERARALSTQHRGPDHPNTLKIMNNLANSYDALNRPADALKLREETLAIRKRVLPQDHPDTLSSMHNLALSYSDLNRPADALKLREETLAIQRRVLPPDHPDTLLSMNNLALSYSDLNRPADALKLHEETLAIRRRVLPHDHPGTLRSVFNLANSYEALNRPADALKLREEVLAIMKRVLPPDHRDTLLSMVHLANSLMQLDRGVEALPLLDEVLAKARTSPAVDPGLIPFAMSLRGQHFQKIGDPAGCRATAEMWEKLNRTDAKSLYATARFRAVTAGIQAKTPGADAARLAKDDADRAMQWLHKAVQAGYKDSAHMKKDTDLDPLREREDFKKLIAELEKKFPPPMKPDPPQPSKKE